ncbi:MAG TPA: ABC transporter permease [Acidimicrobiales bacterium]|nr:ABC transporter permease [Acidimicrobiales bacterium]
MTAAARTHRGPHWLPVSLALARRSLVQTARVPVTFLMLAIMPLFFVVFFSGAFEGLTDLPDYPTEDAVTWVLAFGVVQGAAFAGLGAALPAARDIQSGFFDRLLLTPGTRAAVFLGSLFSGFVRGALVSSVVFLFGLVLGAEFPGGLAGVAVLAVAMLGVVAMSIGWTLGVVYRSVNMASTFAVIQIGIFFPTFLSTGQVPLSEQTGWVHAIARVNPVTNILELARQGMVGHVTWSGTWPGLLALVGSLVVLWTFALRGLAKVGDLP